MTFEETKTWGYRLNQLTRWQAPIEALRAQADEWGFTPEDARAMAEVAVALQAEFRDREPDPLNYRPWDWNDRHQK